MLRSLLHTALFALAAAAAPASASNWSTDASTSTLAFVGGYMGEDFDGSFKQFTPMIRFDPSDLAQARFEVEIDLASASTGDEEWDGYLAGGDFFNVETFPKARFLAERFETTADGFVAHGTLDLRGVQQPVALAFSFSVDGDRAQLKGSAKLDRLAFAVGAGEWEDPETIAHEVTVNTQLTLSRVAE
ncbi:YceI family protein [Aquimonas sp.]|uniref:YceI family protein n=1 Tax=Aquimonas sp. TaxID=1872588 RepID=UPI0037C19837